MARSSSVKEFTFGKKFATFIDAYDFDVDNFATFIIGLPAPVIDKVLDVFCVIVENLSKMYLASPPQYRPEDMDTFVKAQRIHDAIAPFR